MLTAQLVLQVPQVPLAQGAELLVLPAIQVLKVLLALGLLSQAEKLLDPRDDPETLAYAERKLRSP